MDFWRYEHGHTTRKMDDILYTVKSEHELSDMSFKTWLKTLEILSISDHKVSFLGPHRTDGVDYITKKYLFQSM